MFHQGVDLGKNPGIAEGGPADHDRVTPGTFHHPDGVFGVFNIAVADDRDFKDLFDPGDKSPVRLP